jgi:hypothetical protein
MQVLGASEVHADGHWTLKKTMDTISSAVVFSPARKWVLKNLGRQSFYIMSQLVVFYQNAESVSVNQNKAL